MLAEVGNHESLLREYPNGVYAKLVRQQENAEKGNGDEAQDFKKLMEHSDHDTDEGIIDEKDVALENRALGVNHVYQIPSPNTPGVQNIPSVTPDG
jgi:hypothetical protein